MKKLKFLQKMRWKIQKCKKRKICWLFCGPCCYLFYKTAFISANNPIGHRNLSLLIVFNVLIHEISRNLKFQKKVKNRYILKFSSFLVANCVFYFNNLSFSFLTKAWQRICSLLNVFNFLSHQVFRKVHKNRIKLSKTWIFWCFCLFRFEFDAFFKNKLLFPLQKSPRTTNIFLVERLRHSKPPSLSKNRQKLHEIFKNLKFLGFLSFSVWIWGIFTNQIAFITSTTPLGQQNLSLLNVFNFLS